MLSSTTIIVSIPVILFLLWGAVFSSRGILTRFQLETDVANLQIDRDKELFIQDSLKKEIHKLKTDSKTIEGVARERYMMTKPGESVYIVKEK